MPPKFSVSPGDNGDGFYLYGLDGVEGPFASENEAIARGFQLYTNIEWKPAEGLGKCERCERPGDLVVSCKEPDWDEEPGEDVSERDEFTKVVFCRPCFDALPGDEREDFIQDSLENMTTEDRAKVIHMFSRPMTK